MSLLHSAVIAVVRRQGAVCSFLRVINYNSPSLKLSFQGEQATIFDDSRFATDSSFGTADCAEERTDLINHHLPGDSLNHLISSRNFFRSSRVTLVSKSTRRKEFHNEGFHHAARDSLRFRERSAEQTDNRPIKWPLFSEAVTQLWCTW